MHKLAFILLMDRRGLAPGFNLSLEETALARQVRPEVGEMYGSIVGALADTGSRIQRVIDFEEGIAQQIGRGGVQVSGLGYLQFYEYPLLLGLVLLAYSTHKRIREQKKAYYTNFLYLSDSTLRLHSQKCLAFKKYIEDGDFNPVQDVMIDERVISSESEDKDKKFAEF